MGYMGSGRWWPRVSVAAVVTVLGLAAITGMSQPPRETLASRADSTPVTAAPAPTALPPTPGATLAPVAASRTIASQGDVAYALLGGALTLQDIPVRALVAYQLAATAIDLADNRCHLDWEL